MLYNAIARGYDHRKIYTLQAKSRISTYVLHVIIVMFATR